ncbi:MgtC/SapB family protein [Acidaminobacter sp. JC074]|uniref:MgtC/SapB family protein n=1 Tax=Acidaminobacter sp. JC074 TaxID=2530199 RepID=UPI001F0DA27A|nr:MgtC/SapB family protein [Acidaminobacter sp. JC074]MCH4887009.1 MgtC/SapB family protein [Acidaminobacter sp. JC074]
MDLTTLAIRIGLAVVCGGCIGAERGKMNRAAGFRTHILVCLGATIIALIQVETVHETTQMILKNPELGQALKADLGRIVAQVVTGVGFLGAGTIMVDKGSIKGLTTASTVWVVACVGLAIGLGYYEISIIATVAILFVNVVLKRFEHVGYINFQKKNGAKYYKKRGKNEIS